MRLLKHQRFGRSSERHPEAQLGMFNEAEVETDAAEKEEEASGVAIAAHTRQARGGRRPLPAWIPRVEILDDLGETEKVCPADGTALERIGIDLPRATLASWMVKAGDLVQPPLRANIRETPGLLSSL